MTRFYQKMQAYDAYFVASPQSIRDAPPWLAGKLRESLVWAGGFYLFVDGKVMDVIGYGRWIVRGPDGAFADYGPLLANLLFDVGRPLKADPALKAAAAGFAPFVIHAGA